MSLSSTTPCMRPIQRATAFISGHGRPSCWKMGQRLHTGRPVSLSPLVKVIVAFMVVSVLDLSENQCPYGVTTHFSPSSS